MHKIFFLCVVLLCGEITYSQINHTNTLTPQELVEQVLVGTGVVVSNFSFNNVPANAQAVQPNVTSFTATGFPFASGIFMGTSGGGDISGDPDLTDLANNPVTNGASIEFDFIPSGDTIKFRYIFGSVEYPGYTCSQYNDAFGFFISGPGISGPFSNSSINLATVPGTSIPVSINTVNSGVSSSGDDSECIAADPNFVNNVIYFTNDYNDMMGFEGGTVAMTAITGLQCGQTYHIKLAVANAVDQALDSGVFLEANSLSVSGVNLNLTTITGGSVVYEGTCSVADFILTRPGCFLDQPLTINYAFSGTATENVDYLVSPAGNTVTFQPFEDTIILSLSGIVETPNLVENNETIIFTGTYVNQLGTTVTISDQLIMAEDAIIDATSNDPTIICPEDSVLLTVEAIGGTAPYVYTWQDGQLSDTAFFAMMNTGVQNINVTILDFCGFTFVHTIPITYPDPGPLTFVPQDVTVFCPDHQVTMNATAINGVPPYSFDWSTGATGTSIIDSILVNNTSQQYTVTVTDFCGFTNQGVTNLTLNQTLNIDSLVPISSQLCVDNGMITPHIRGETGTILYSWKGPVPDTNSVTSTEIHTGIPSGWYYLTVVDDVCQDRDSIFVDFTPDPIAAFSFTVPSEDPPIDVIFVNESQHANTFDWDFGNGDNLTVTTLDNQTGTYADTGYYAVTLVARNGPCSSTITHDFIILLEPRVSVTDIFTPNGDDKNDVFTINPFFFAEFKIQIFNRWGEIMFEGDYAIPNWDGKTPSGKDANEGVYFYTYKGKGYTGTELEGHGNLQLTR